MDEWWGGLVNWQDWQWGSAAEWVTGLLTFVTVLVAALTFFHQRSSEHRSHAKFMKIGWDVGIGDPELFGLLAPEVIRLKNVSGLPFVDVALFFVPEKTVLEMSTLDWKE
ncbi:hypothetical protein EDF22_1345 [Rathayibacter sp. PhB127]|uniref:hypothetical protein n=1 Tax=Rathayibacter sp. PhB127 TaxID=2485176 RepID=UPI000F4BF446|nr:hypothetical protein [Rathayibacter sp. PhB127]ROS29601.1 hypothetical protein EDF22_1345 [Rathayibacter sp. PhB127]